MVEPSKTWSSHWLANSYVIVSLKKTTANHEPNTTQLNIIVSYMTAGGMEQL